MAVSKKEGRWQLTCFACAFSGTAVDLVMSMDSCTVAEAFKVLAGKSTREMSPVDLHPVDYIMLVCDRCGNTRKVTGETYKVPGKQGPIWTTTPIEEVFAASSHGWEVSAQADFALCPPCLS